MARAVTLLDVAKVAGVSKTTVGNVFSRPERVRPALRAHVEAVAREIGYTGPDPRGRLLSSGKANAIGVVPPADASYSWVFSDPYMGEFLTGVAQICEQRRVGLSLITAKDSQGAWAIRNAVVDGFILSSIEQAEFIEPAMRRKLPFVVMDVDGGADISSVRVDDRAGARQLTRHLVDLGHRRFAVASISRKPIAPVVHLPGRGARRLVAAYPGDLDRMAGVADALAEARLSLDDVWIVEACGTDEERRLYGRGGAEMLLDNARDVTAIIALSAPLASSILKAAALARHSRAGAGLRGGIRRPAGSRPALSAAHRDPPARRRERSHGGPPPLRAGNRQARGPAGRAEDPVVDRAAARLNPRRAALGADRRRQAPTRLGSRQARSKGSRQACGATNWWIAFGPHEPGA